MLMSIGTRLCTQACRTPDGLATMFCHLPDREVCHSDFPVWAAVQHRARLVWRDSAGKPLPRTGTGTSAPRCCLGQPAPAAPRRPGPSPTLSWQPPPHTSSVSMVPSGSGALQGRHLLLGGHPSPALPGLAPDRSRLHVGREPAPGTSGPASLGRRPTP